jgi:DNA-binding transcriptional LysR family regulator
MRTRMDWMSLRFDWNHARAFLATAETGSLSAAARAMKATQPTLSRQVDALERELGVILFERVGRGLELTPTGLELLEHVRFMGRGAADMSLTASGKSQTIEGKICITASEVYSAFVLPPLLMGLRQAHPGIEVEILASNAPSDLLRREADIAIRNMPTIQPDLIVKKIGDDRGRLYASKDYLHFLGYPEKPNKLSGANFVGFANTDILIKGLNSLGMGLSQSNFPFICDNHLVQWAMVKQGLGIGVITQHVGDIEPLVDRVIPNLDPIPIPMWLVTHRELHTSLRVRTVYDFLSAGLKRHLSENDVPRK